MAPAQTDTAPVPPLNSVCDGAQVAHLACSGFSKRLIRWRICMHTCACSCSWRARAAASRQSLFLPFLARLIDSCMAQRTNGLCDRVASRRLNYPLPPLPLLSLSLPPPLSSSSPFPPPLPLHLRKRGASRQPAIETLRGKSHLVAIIPLHAWGPIAALRGAICAPRAAWRPAAANYKATHLRTRREVRG